MALSPLVLVQDGAGPWVPTTNGVDVTPGNSIGIKLVSTTDVVDWYLQILGTDELISPPSLTGVNIIDNKVITPGTIVTFTMPTGVGHALRFQSQVTGSGGPLTTTFGIYALTAHGRRVGASSEEREGNGTYGWITITNPILRLGAAVTYYNDAAALPTLGSNSVQGVIDALKATLGGRALSLSAPAPSNVLTWDGSKWAPAAVSSGFTAGGDLTGTSTDQTVSKIRGLSSPDPVNASQGRVISVVEDIPVPDFVSPRSVVSDGVHIYIAESSMTTPVGSAVIRKVLSSGDGSIIDVVAQVDLSLVLGLVDRVRDLAQDSTYLYAACWDAENVAIIDKATMTIAGWGHMGSGQRAVSVCTDSLGYFYCYGNGPTVLSKFNLVACLGQPPGTVTSVADYVPGSNARWVRYGGGHIWLTDGGNGLGIEKIDPATMTRVTFNTTNAAMSALYAFGSVWITEQSGTDVLRLNPLTLAVQATIPVPGAGTMSELVLGPDSAGNPDTRIYVSDEVTSNVNVIDPTTESVEATFTLPGDFRGNPITEGLAVLGDVVYAMAFLGVLPWVFYVNYPAATSGLTSYYTYLVYSDPPAFTAGGDLSGNSTSQTVIALRGFGISSSFPSLGQALVWDGSSWVPTTPAGDVTGPVAANTVGKIQGRTVAATAPTAGQVYYYDGAQWTPSSLAGDVTGSIAANTVGKIQGRTVVATAPTAGQVYYYTGTQWSPASLAGDVTGSFISNTVAKIQNRAVASTAPTNGQVLTWVTGSTQWQPQTPSGGGLPTPSLAADIPMWSGSVWEAKQPPAGLVNVTCGETIASGGPVVLEQDRTGATTNVYAYSMSVADYRWGWDQQYGSAYDISWKSGARLSGTYLYDATALTPNVCVIVYYDSNNINLSTITASYNTGTGYWSLALGAAVTSISLGAATATDVCIAALSPTEFVIGWINVSDGKAYLCPCTYVSPAAGFTYGTPTEATGWAYTDIISLALERAEKGSTANIGSGTNTGKFVCAFGRSSTNAGQLFGGSMNSGNTLSLQNSSYDSYTTFGSATCPPKCITLRSLGWGLTNDAGIVPLKIGVLYGDKARGADLFGAQWTGSVNFERKWGYTYLAGSFLPTQNLTLRVDGLDTFSGGATYFLDGSTAEPGFGDFIGPSKFLNMFLSNVTNFNTRTILAPGTLHWDTPCPGRAMIMPYSSSTEWGLSAVTLRQMGQSTFVWGGRLTTRPASGWTGLDPIGVGAGYYREGEFGVSTGSIPDPISVLYYYFVPTAQAKYQRFLPVRMSNSRFIFVFSGQQNNSSPTDCNRAIFGFIDEKPYVFGIMQEAGTIGQVKRCATIGGVSRVHSGLIQGRTYYMTYKDAALSLHPTDTPLGVAISSTELALNLLRRPDQAW